MVSDVLKTCLDNTDFEVDSNDTSHLDGSTE